MATANAPPAISPGHYVAEVAEPGDERFRVFLRLGDDDSYHTSYDNVTVRRTGRWLYADQMLHFATVRFEEDGMIGLEDDRSCPTQDVTKDSFQIRDPRESPDWLTFRQADLSRPDYQERFRRGSEPMPALDNASQVVVEHADREFDIVESVASHVNVCSDAVYPQPCTYLTTHLVCMRVAGCTDVDFDELAAVSGASALFGYEHGSFLPKYASQHIDMATRIAEATGLVFERIPVEEPELAWAAIVESINAGAVVKGWEAEMVVFAGYEVQAAEERRKVLVMSDGALNYKAWWLWPRFVEWTRCSPGNSGMWRFSRHVAKRAPRDVAFRVIGDLVAWSAKPPPAARQAYPQATFGLAGIKAYAEDCANTDKYADWSACHDVNPLWTVRRSSAVYLQRVAQSGLFAGEASESILAAANDYREAYRAWREFYDQLGYGAPPGAGKVKQRRLKGAHAIEKALGCETSAVDHLRKVLELVP